MGLDACVEVRHVTAGGVLLLLLLLPGLAVATPELQQLVQPRVPGSDRSTAISALVLRLRGDEALSGIGRSANELMVAELALQIARVVTTSDLKRLVEQERLKDLLDCDEVNCLSEIGGALAVDWLVVGNLSRSGTNYVFGLRVFSAADGEILAATSEQAVNESQLLVGIPGWVEDVVRMARGLTPRSPVTFFTAEVSASLSGSFDAESYYPGPGGTVRIAWGGLWPPIGWYFYILAGFQISHLWGSNRTFTGEIDYRRTQLAPFAALRMGMPIANDGDTRVNLSIGFGGLFEIADASQRGGVQATSELWKPELRALAGMSHKLGDAFTLFGNYRLRAQIGGRGTDTVSELVAFGSTDGVKTIHEIELGCGFHF